MEEISFPPRPGHQKYSKSPPALPGKAAGFPRAFPGHFSQWSPTEAYTKLFSGGSSKMLRLAAAFADVEHICVAYAGVCSICGMCRHMGLRTLGHMWLVVKWLINLRNTVRGLSVGFPPCPIFEYVCSDNKVFHMCLILRKSIWLCFVSR